MMKRLLTTVKVSNNLKPKIDWQVALMDKLTLLEVVHSKETEGTGKEKPN